MKDREVYPWGTARRFNSLADYFTGRFGARVQKVSVNAGFTCPNRDGLAGVGGCAYCNNLAFSPSYCSPHIPVKDQIEKGIAFHRKRYRRADSFLVYFQSYTNTYGDPGRLRQLYNDALSVPGVKGLVIGTRPDCVNDEILGMIAEFAASRYVIIEYGIESCYNRTLRAINRGHDFETSVSAIKRTAEFGIRTGGHIIFGLPGESRNDMLDEAAILSRLPLNNLKFHQLQIVKDTVMAGMYRDDPGMFNLFDPDDYIEFMADFTELLNPSFIIERFAGEVPLRFLSGGKRWGIRNDRFLHLFEKKLEERDSWQGKRYVT